MPKTKLGKWTVGLAIAVVVFYYIGILVRPDVNGSGIFDAGESLFALAMIAQALSGIVAVIVGLVAIFKVRDRSILVYLALLFGLLIFINTVIFLFSLAGQTSQNILPG
jgi:hypothetical protein